jgi:hypothetical protein
VKRSRISSVGWPIGTVRVMSVVPSWYWPPESSRNSSPSASLRLVTRDELHWLDQYHARVLAEIGPMLDGETLAWLEKATAPLPHDAKI